MSKSLSEFTTLTFDCYGTLIDWETGIWDALQPLILENDGQAPTRSESLRAFAEEESRIEKGSPGMLYSDVLRRVHTELARRFGLRTREKLDADFGGSVGQWPAFSDTAEALRSLKRRYKLVILSNVHREGFTATNRKLGVRFDAIYTAQDIGSYKPSPRNFEYLLEHVKAELGVEKRQILHTAQSLYHDHVPAHAIGLANAWIDRQGLSEGGDWGAVAGVREPPELDFVFRTLRELAEAAERA